MRFPTGTILLALAFGLTSVIGIPTPLPMPDHHHGLERQFTRRDIDNALHTQLHSLLKRTGSVSINAVQPARMPVRRKSSSIPALPSVEEELEDVDMEEPVNVAAGLQQPGTPQYPPIMHTGLAHAGFQGQANPPSANHALSGPSFHMQNAAAYAHRPLSEDYPMGDTPQASGQTSYGQNAGVAGRQKRKGVEEGGDDYSSKRRKST